MRAEATATVCMCVYVCVCVYVCACLCVCVCVCLCVADDKKEEGRETVSFVLRSHISPSPLRTHTQRRRGCRPTCVWLCATAAAAPTAASAAAPPTSSTSTRPPSTTHRPRLGTAQAQPPALSLLGQGQPPNLSRTPSRPRLTHTHTHTHTKHTHTHTH